MGQVGAVGLGLWGLGFFSKWGFESNFVLVLIMTSGLSSQPGGPANSTLMYGLYLYLNAFRFFKMGYASALAWVLLLIIIGITVVQFRLARMWVFYEGETREANKS